MEAFRKLADEYSLWIIEDACHAPGGSFKDSDDTPQNCGNGNFADLAIFSFHPVKHIACGEGGMITTNDFKIYEKLYCIHRYVTSIMIIPENLTFIKGIVLNLNMILNLNFFYNYFLKFFRGDF
mgnify:CR=1 FL=1